MYLVRPVTLLLKWIYRLDEPNLIRDRPMKVLALGLSRCGTESLKLALEDLGYKGVLHGYDIKGDQAMVMTRLWEAKMTKSSKTISAEDFDRFIGNYEAVTDAVGYMFAKELIEAYPNAKVILNRRNDVAAWDRSMRTTLVRGLRDNWWLDYLSLFSPDYFWLRQITAGYIVDFFDGSFEKHGVDVYQAYYRQLEDMLGEGNYLNWTVEDGWEPLCAFLDKPVPDKPLPSGNASPAFMKRLAERRAPLFQQARVNVAKTLGAVVASVFAMWMAYVRLGR